MNLCMLASFYFVEL